VSLEQDAPNNFDLLVLDAFSGDSIPTHLLTQEAMRLYVRHLGPEGVLAFHISNNHLDLEPVLRSLAERSEMRAILVPPTDLHPSTGKLSSIWMLLTKSHSFCRQADIADLVGRSDRADSGKRLVWTDDHYTILPILR
jgi:hypothetical protein